MPMAIPSPDSNACEELRAEIEAEGADQRPHVCTGLSEGSGKVIKHRVHRAILDRNAANVNPIFPGVIAPVLSDC